MPALTGEDLAIILTALAAGGVVKGVTGLGLPLVAVPVMAGFLGVERAVIVMIIPGVLINAWQAWMHRDHVVDVPELPRLLAWGIPGAVVGAWVLYEASERALATALAVWVGAYLGLRYFRPDLRLDTRTRWRLAPGVGALAGALQASTGISAPVIASYMHAVGLKPAAYVFAVAVPFGVFAGAHGVILVVLQAYTPQLLLESLLAILPAVAFIRVGERLRRRVRPGTFDLLIRGILAMMAARLLYSAWLAGGPA